MKRRRFLKQSASAVPVGLVALCGGSLAVASERAARESVRISGVEVGEKVTLAPYTHPPIELSDDFDGAVLGQQWRVVGLNTYIPAMWSLPYGKGRESDAVKVSLGDSRVRVRGWNNRTAGLCLYGMYGGRKRLETPWAMEAVLELPNVDFSKTPVRAGITVRVSNAQGWGAYVEVGRLAGGEINKSFLFHEAVYQEGWTGHPEIEATQRVHLRIESSDKDRRGVRCGMKAKQKDAWVWSPLLHFSQPILWLDNLQLMIFNTQHGGLRTKTKEPPPVYSEFVDEELKRSGPGPTGEEVTISFDSVRFEGKALSLKEGIEYIRSEIPQVEVNGPPGDRYEVLVPDTLDIEERAKLAIHALTSLTDPNADYEIYWWGDCLRRPPVLVHELSDQVQCKFMEALPLLRMVAGSEENLYVEQRWCEVALKMQGPDGLLYIPAVGRPWNWTAVWEAVGNREEQFAVPIINGRLLGAMTIWHFRDGSSVWREASAKVLDGLLGITVDRGSYAFFPFRAFRPGDRASQDEPPAPPGSQYAFVPMWVIIGLVQHYRATRSEKALTLAGKLLAYVKDHSGSYAPDGDWIGFPHFHCHTHGIQAMIEYGLATNSSELLQFSVQSFEHGKKRGNSLVGFFPEWYEIRDYPSSEICEVADMIAIACKLASSGVHDCWEDLDRWVRNQFAENQMTSTDWIYDYTAKFAKSSHWCLNESPDGMAERSLGAFAGWGTGNDFWEGNRYGPFMHCCTGNATRALYYVWENILRPEGNQVRVNLLLNRTSPWLDLASYIPYQGKVELTMKQTRRLLIRIPEWTDQRRVECLVQGQPRQFNWSGQYIDVGTVNTGEKLAVEFPISVRTVETVIGGKQYKLRFKGNDVVDIKPEGTICPMYQRDHYWHGPVRYKKVTRFCAQRTIDW